MNGALWQAVLGEIELKTSPAEFATWFKQTSLLENKNGSVVVGVSHIFAQKQIEAKFHELIIKTLRGNGQRVRNLSYRLHSKVALSAPPAQLLGGDIKPPETINPSMVRTNYGNLNGRYTLDSFVVGSSNELAYAASQVVTREPGEKYNPLFVYGGAGLGKTHLIQAVGNEILRRKPNTRVQYITSERFAKEFIGAILSKRSFTNHYRSVDVLIVDDMQFLAGKERVQEEFFHTFNTLHLANKQIIMSSDKPPKAIPTLEERLHSRFEAGMTIDIQPPDFETRVAILQTKAARTKLNYPPEVFEYIANHIQSNIRELEGALTKLIAWCEMCGVSPSLQLVEQLISTSRVPSRYINAKQIIDKTAHFFNLTTAELTSARRVREVVEPRQVAMYLMRSELHLSFPQIAKQVGRSDHTTAIHSINKIEKALLSNQNFRARVHELKEKLYV